MGTECAKRALTIHGPGGMVTKMVKRRLVGPVMAALVALTPSCLGGQTGQPDSLSCQPRALAPGESWQGHSVQELAEAFVGTHRGSLRWVKELPTAPRHTPVDFDDQLAISVTAAGVTGTLVSCGGGLDVTVEVALTTTQSNLADRSVATLSFTEWQPTARAQLSFDGKELSVDAELAQTDVSLAPQGYLIPRVESAPGASAFIR